MCARLSHGRATLRQAHGQQLQLLPLPHSGSAALHHLLDTAAHSHRIPHPAHLRTPHAAMAKKKKAPVLDAWCWYCE